MTVVYGVKGEDGRALDWPLLALAARECWGWAALPPVERSPRGKPYFPDRPDRSTGGRAVQPQHSRAASSSSGQSSALPSLPCAP